MHYFLLQQVLMAPLYPHSQSRKNWEVRCVFPNAAWWTGKGDCVFPRKRPERYSLLYFPRWGQEQHPNTSKARMVTPPNVSHKAWFAPCVFVLIPLLKPHTAHSELDKALLASLNLSSWTLLIFSFIPALKHQEQFPRSSHDAQTSHG